jgi:hypothetical protein
MLWKVLTGVGLLFSVSYGVAAAQQEQSTRRLLAMIPEDELPEVLDRVRRRVTA